MRIAVGVLGSLLLAATSVRSARADAQAIAIEQAIAIAPGVRCLQREPLAAQVRFWLGRSQVDADVRVRVRAAGRGVEFELVRGRSRGTRTFDPLPAGCDQAQAAVGLAIALAIDAELLARLVEPEPAGAAPDAAPRSALLTFQLGGGHALLPGWSFGLTTGFELELLQWLSGRAELIVEHAPSVGIESSSGRFDASLFAGAVGVCAGGRPVRELRLALCALPSAGALHARGHDFEASYSPTGLWIGIVSGLRIELITPVPLVLDLDVIAPLRSPSFRVEREGAPALRREPSSAGFLLRIGGGFEL